METTNHSVIKTAVSVWLRLLLATIFCFVVWASIFALGTALFSEEVGYRIYQLDESGTKNTLVTEYRYAAGESRPTDLKLTDGQSLYPLRENSPQTETGIGCISMAFTLIIFGVFPYSVLWRMGSHDNNYVQLGRMKSDRLFGMKVGLVTSIPCFCLYFMLVLGRCGVVNGVVLNWFRVLNTAFIPYIDAVTQGAKTAADLSIGALLAAGVVVLFIPVVCTVAYILGFAQVSVRERFIYKKKPQ